MKNQTTKHTQSSKARTKRGLMTISPPAKVKSDALAGGRSLSSGVDSLNLALDVKWTDEYIFEILELTKSNAHKLNKPIPFPITIPSRNEKLTFDFMPHGTKGYKWLFSNNEFAFRMYDAIEPRSRPNVMAEIRSETLWRRGIRESLLIIREALERWGADIQEIKTSRIDLCMDILLPAHQWNEGLLANLVTRARNEGKFTKNKYLTGVQIGKGKFSGRLYDKALEIETKSFKTWMYDIWEIKEVPEDMRAIRIEFQLFRESIKELGLNTIDETLQNLEAIWAYCTQKWLKFQTNPGNHHTQRKTLPWWKLVQDSFLGIQKPTPAIRAKAIRTTQKQLARQLIGLTTSFAATKDEFGDAPALSEITFKSLGDLFVKAIRLSGKSEEDLRDSINEKKAKNYRGKERYRQANEDRLSKGLPADTESLIYALQNPYWLQVDDNS